jgi:hypothetical protein
MARQSVIWILCSVIPSRCKRGGTTDPAGRLPRAWKWFGPGAYCSRTRRDIATTRGYKDSFCGQDIRPLSCMSTHSPWSSRSLWSTHFERSGCNYRNEICRKGRGTGEEYPNSHFQLQLDVRNRARRRHRRGEQQFFSWGATLKRSFAQTSQKGKDEQSPPRDTRN